MIVNATFSHYRDSSTNFVYQKSTLRVQDPCKDPESLSSSSQTDPPAYKYSGDSPAINFVINPFVVEPPICTIKYDCSVLSGPVNTLCNAVTGDPKT